MKQPYISGYRRADTGTHPTLDTPAYGSTRWRSPKHPLVPLSHTLTEITGPLSIERKVGALEQDLTRSHANEPIGERIIVHGRVLDGDERPVRHAVVEIWQANAAGRYLHPEDTHAAPVDANFTGKGRCRTDEAGRYEFVTIRPGAYPWKNHPNAWRPAHIHFSLFGEAFAQRLVTQMYFPGDPLFFQDPIFNAISDERARARLIAGFDLGKSVAGWALAFAFDIVLSGREATPTEVHRP
jgi:protocatechuate 3,4-dioxygenase, beta subunit